MSYRRVNSSLGALKPESEHSRRDCANCATQFRQPAAKDACNSVCGRGRHCGGMANDRPSFSAIEICLRFLDFPDCDFAFRQHANLRGVFRRRRIDGIPASPRARSRIDLRTDNDEGRRSGGGVVTLASLA